MPGTQWCGMATTPIIYMQSTYNILLLKEQGLSVSLAMHFAVRAPAGLKLHKGVAEWSAGTNTTFPGALDPVVRAT